MNEKTVAGYWDANAPAWIEGVRAGHDIYRDQVNNPIFFDSLPDLAGKRVLDVGCGEGYNTRMLADLGAHVTGVDISSRMIQAAIEHEQRQSRSIQYHVASGSDLSIFVDCSFDAAVSTMALMDMPDYNGCVQEVARVLRPGGFFQFSITHPCSMTRAWKWMGDENNPKQYMRIANYFSLQETGDTEEVSQWYFSGVAEDIKKKATKFQVPDFYRTLSEYFNTLVDSGFMVQRLLEPFATKAIAEKFKGVAETRNIPYFLVFQCVKK